MAPKNPNVHCEESWPNLKLPRKTRLVKQKTEGNSSCNSRSNFCAQPSTITLGLFIYFIYLLVEH